MKTVDIITTQNVTIEYELASAGQRIGAFMIDIIIATVGFSIFSALLQAVFRDSVVSGYMIYFLLVLFAFYTFLSETLLHGQTLGKRAMDIKVIKLNGEIPSAADNFLRWTFRLIDIWITMGSLATTLVSSSAKAQRLGNLATHTVVINKKSKLIFNLSDILNISALENYTPTFPDVRRLNEQDMIVIKTTILRTDKYRNNAHYDARVELVKRLANILGIPYANIRNHEQFLKILLKDYIVLTR